MHVVFKPAPGTDVDHVIDEWRDTDAEPAVGDVIALTPQNAQFKVMQIWQPSENSALFAYVQAA